jgi:hypothetical protein
MMVVGCCGGGTGREGRERTACNTHKQMWSNWHNEAMNIQTLYMAGIQHIKGASVGDKRYRDGYG